MKSLDLGKCLWQPGISVSWFLALFKILHLLEIMQELSSFEMLGWSNWEMPVNINNYEDLRYLLLTVLRTLLHILHLMNFWRAKNSVLSPFLSCIWARTEMVGENWNNMRIPELSFICIYLTMKTKLTTFSRVFWLGFVSLFFCLLVCVCLLPKQVISGS